MTITTTYDPMGLSTQRDTWSVEWNGGKGETRNPAARPFADTCTVSGEKGILFLYQKTSFRVLDDQQLCLRRPHTCYQWREVKDKFLCVCLQHKEVADYVGGTVGFDEGHDHMLVG